MNTRCAALCLAIVCAATGGCHPFRFKSQPQTSALGRKVSTLKSSLERGEITLDEYERSKQEIVQARADNDDER